MKKILTKFLVVSVIVCNLFSFNVLAKDISSAESTKNATASPYCILPLEPDEKR